MIPAKIYPVVIPAGGSFPLQAVGSLFKVLSASGTFSVAGDTFGTLGAIQPGQGLDNTPFQRLTFTDTSGGQNTLQVLIADARFIDDRITGEVAVIDGAKALVLSDLTFMYAGTVGPPAAGKVSSAALVNNVSSGKRFIIKSYSFSTDLAGVAVRIGRMNGAGATWTGTTTGYSKRITQSNPVASVGQVKTATDGVLAAPLSHIYESFVMEANKTVVRTLDEPIVLEPNAGFAIDLNTADRNLGFSFQWREELIV